jgi:GTPase SAR1 family protein
MDVKLRKPILVGGIGLSMSLWLLESAHHSVMQLGEWGLLGVLGAGAAAWWFGQQTPPILPASAPLDRQAVEKAIAAAETAIAQLQAETANQPSADATALISALQERIGHLKAELDRQELRLAVIGGKGTGKSTLLQVLQSEWLPQHSKNAKFTVSTAETPALFAQNGDSAAQTGAIEQAKSSDLVLFLTAGDITDPEYQTLQQLTNAGVRTLLVWNKQDQHLPEERATVLQQQRYRLLGTLESEDVVAISAAPAPVKVRQHQQDGSVREWMEQPAPDLAPLTSRLSQILTESAENLVLTTAIRAANSAKTEAQTALNGLRRSRAMPAIEQYQWIAAAAAFANPLPALDLLATAAVNAQLVADLGAIYQQKFSLQQAQTVAGTMGSLMLKLGLVELSTQTVGGVLKSHAVTYVAGGAVQGVSAAYLTRIAGLSLIEYFQAQEAVAADGQTLNPDKLSQTLQAVFQQNQRIAFVQSFVKQALGRLAPESAQPVTVSQA